MMILYCFIAACMACFVAVIIDYFTHDKKR